LVYNDKMIAVKKEVNVNMIFNVERKLAGLLITQSNTCGREGHNEHVLLSRKISKLKRRDPQLYSKLMEKLEDDLTLIKRYLLQS